MCDNPELAPLPAPSERVLLARVGIMTRIGNGNFGQFELESFPSQIGFLWLWFSFCSLFWLGAGSRLPGWRRYSEKQQSQLAWNSSDRTPCPVGYRSHSEERHYCVESVTIRFPSTRTVHWAVLIVAGSLRIRFPSTRTVHWAVLIVAGSLRIRFPSTRTVHWAVLRVAGCRVSQ